MLEQSSPPRMKPWQWVVFAAVVAAAFLLRVHDLSRIFLWLDETDLFNESIYGNHHRSLLDFAFGTRNGTTQSWGWSAIFWIVTRAFGPSIAVARMPAVLVNTAGVALLFALVYRLLPESSVNRFWPALFAAIFAAIFEVQMNYSQQTYPYGATPFLAFAGCWLTSRSARPPALNGRGRRACSARLRCTRPRSRCRAASTQALP